MNQPASLARPRLRSLREARIAAIATAALAVSCGTEGHDRAPTSGSLTASGGASTPAQRPNRVLIGEFIGTFDPDTKQFTVVPAMEANDQLGLTGKANPWGINPANSVHLVTAGGTYVDNLGTLYRQPSVFTPCAVYTATNNCGTSGTQACVSATCATMTLQSTGVVLGAVDIEVTGISAAVKIENDDVSSSALTAEETRAGVDGGALGMWRWPSAPAASPIGSPLQGTAIWQFNTAILGLHWVVGFRAWIQAAATTVNLGFTVSPDNFNTLVAPSTTTKALIQLQNTGTAMALTAKLSSPTIVGSSAFTVSADTCTNANLGATAFCTISVTLTCTATTNGTQNATISYTDSTSGNTGSLDVTGVCTPQVVLNFAPTNVSLGTTPIGTPVVGATPGVLTNTGANTTGAFAAPTITGSSAFSFAGCTGSTLATNQTCNVVPTLTCTTATPGFQSATATYTDPTSGVSTNFTATGTCDVLKFTPTSGNVGSVDVGAPVTGSPASLKNVGGTTTGVLTGPVTTGSTAFSFTGCAGTALAAGVTCSVFPKLTCTSATLGVQTTTATYTDPTSGLSSTYTATGTCTSPAIAFSPTSEAVGFGATGTPVSGAGMTMTNSGTASTGVFAAPTVTGSSAFTFSGCTGSSLSTSGAGASCTVVPTLTCTASTVGALTATATYTDPTSGVASTVTVTGNCTPVLTTSCKALLAASPGIASGGYLIKPNATTLQTVCDMTFDAGDGNGAGGWTLIELTTASTTASTWTQATQLVQGTEGYFPIADMKTIANASRQIHWRSPVAYPHTFSAADQFITTTADAKPIQNLRLGINADTTADGQATDAGGFFVEHVATYFLQNPFSSGSTMNNISSVTGSVENRLDLMCSTTLAADASVWPSTYWSCGNAHGFHMRMQIQGGVLVLSSTWDYSTANVALETYIR